MRSSDWVNFWAAIVFGLSGLGVQLLTDATWARWVGWGSLAIAFLICVVGLFRWPHKPDVTCEIIASRAELPGITAILGHVTLSRRRRFSRVLSIESCRLVLRWVPTNGAQSVRSVKGVWGDLNQCVYERTLSEGNPDDLIPLFVVFDRSDRIPGKKYIADQLYVVDGPLATDAPETLLTTVLPGEYWLRIELSSGVKGGVALEFLVSSSSVAKFVMMEPRISTVPRDLMPAPRLICRW